MCCRLLSTPSLANFFSLATSMSYNMKSVWYNFHNCSRCNRRAHLELQCCGQLYCYRWIVNIVFSYVSLLQSLPRIPPGRNVRWVLYVICCELCTSGRWCRLECIVRGLWSHLDVVGYWGGVCSRGDRS